MMPGRSVRSAKSSGLHLNDMNTGAGSVAQTANIFPPILNTRSLPHCTVSVALGNDRQCFRTASSCIQTSIFHGERAFAFKYCRASPGFTVYVFSSQSSVMPDRSATFASKHVIVDRTHVSISLIGFCRVRLH